VTRQRWAWVSLGLFAVSPLASSPARADAPPEAPVRVAVLPFDGPAASRAEQRVRTALRQRKSQVRLVGPPARVRAAAAAAAPGSPRDYAELAQDLQADALVSGRVRRTQGRWSVRVWVRHGSTGELVGEARWSHSDAGPLLARVGRQAWPRLGEAMEGTRAPPPEPDRAPAEPVATPRSEPSEQTPAPTSAEEAAEARPSRPSAIRIAAGLQLLSRRFTFHDDLFDALASYRLGSAPAVALEGEWYPGAHWTSGAAANLGLRVRYVSMFATRSEPSINVGGESFQTRHDRLEGGLRARVPLARGELALGTDVGRQRFLLHVPEGGQARALPSVAYSYVRFEAAASYQPRPWLRLDLLAGYLHPWAFGELGSDAWFPRVSGGGVDGRAVAAFVLASQLELRVVAEARRIFLHMHPEPGDARVAGGGLDQVRAVGLELGWRH
jgi:hypothetical protein